MNSVIVSYKNKIENYKEVIQDFIKNGAVDIDDIIVITAKGDYKFHLSEIIKNNRTVILKISERNCTDCNRKCINQIEGLCKHLNIPFVILVSDARSAMIIRKKYGERCYLVQEEIKKGILSNTSPLMFTMTNLNLGYGFLEVYKKDSSVIISYLNCLRMVK